MKKWITIYTCTAVLAAWAIRFVYLNTHTPLPDPLYYSMGEVVAYEDDFFSAADENRNGYSIVVDKATVYGYEEFADKMGIELPRKSETVFRAEYVYDLEVTVYNEENEDGGIDLFNTILVHANARLPIDTTLWERLYPQLGGSYTFRLRPNTQMVFHFPFVVETSSDQQEIDLEYLQENSFFLYLTSYPNKKMIEVKAS